MIGLEDARAAILASCERLAAVSLPLEESLGCVTAEPVVAAESVPSFANTAMDGYAVRAADTVSPPVELAVVDTVPAGQAPQRGVGPGEAVRIMTGAPMPAGADAVVMVERTRPAGGGQRVVVERAAAAGDHIRPVGGDIAAGQLVFEAGTVLGAGHLGVLASLGWYRVSVFPPPRVAVLSTGDELVDESVALNPGQIRDSNRPTLLALLRQNGCVPVDLGLARDDEAAIAAAVQEGASTCDALITSGGVSVGDYDYVKAVLERLGDMHWWQVAIKPAKPLAFGVVAGKPVFGLPGNPVSSMVSFELFARPALRRMMGHAQLYRPQMRAIADEDICRQVDGKVHFVRVTAAPGGDGRFHVRSAGGQGSHQLLVASSANALAVLADGEGVRRGGDVAVMLLA